MQKNSGNATTTTSDTPYLSHQICGLVNYSTLIFFLDSSDSYPNILIFSFLWTISIVQMSINEF